VRERPLEIRFVDERGPEALIESGEPGREGFVRV
jgi:hypothetical protein